MAGCSLVGIRIAFISDLKLGGVFTAMRRYMTVLIEMGAEVTLISMDADGVNRGRVPAGVKVVPISFNTEYRAYLTECDCHAGPYRRLAYKILKRVGLPCRNSYPDLYEYALKGFDLDFDEPFDAVFDFLGYGNITTAIGAVLPAKYRATWVHDEDVFCFSKAIAYAHLYDDIFCVSKTVQEAYLFEYSSLSGKVSVLYNQLDFEGMHLRSEKPTVFPRRQGVSRLLSVGRLAEQKGFDLAVRVASLIKGRGLVFEWLIAGDGPLRGELEKLIEAEGVSDCVQLVGRIDNACAEMSAADLIVQPSRHEGFGITAIEAVAARTPVVASDIGPFREINAAGANMHLAPLVDSAFASAVEEELSLAGNRVSGFLNAAIIGTDSVEVLATRLLAALKR